jgi:hypothetical protein
MLAHLFLADQSNLEHLCAVMYTKEDLCADVEEVAAKELINWCNDNDIEFSVIVVKSEFRASFSVYPSASYNYYLLINDEHSRVMFKMFHLDKIVDEEETGPLLWEDGMWSFKRPARDLSTDFDSMCF